MTSTDEANERHRTAATMHSSAYQLEEVEDSLHRSAQRSPDAATTQRLDELGDAVSAEARRIDGRADRITSTETSGTPH